MRRALDEKFLIGSWAGYKSGSQNWKVFYQILFLSKRKKLLAPDGWDSLYISLQYHHVNSSMKISQGDEASQSMLVRHAAGDTCPDLSGRTVLRSASLPRSGSTYACSMPPSNIIARGRSILSDRSQIDPKHWGTVFNPSALAAGLQDIGYKYHLSTNTT